MGEWLPAATGPRRLVLATALLVAVGVALLGWVVAAGEVEFVSLYTAELALMLLVVAWLGVVRPVRSAGAR